METEAYAALGVVVAAVITYFGVRYTAQQSSRAQQESASMEGKAIDAAAYERARESYEAAIRQYTSEILRLEGRVDSLTSRIESLNREIAALEDNKRDQRYDLEATVELLTQARDEHEGHLKRCQDRLSRLRERLAVYDDIADDDPDLRLEP